MKKRILFLFTLAFALCACCLFASAKTFETKTVDHVVYIFYPETETRPEYCAVMSLFDTKEAMKGVTELTIPAEVDGVPVKSIFFDNLKLGSYVEAEVETIHLPDTLESISLKAFLNMRSLKTVNIPESVTAIGQSAFSGCTGLTEITLPEGLLGLGKGCFKACKNLKTVDIQGNGLKKIGYAAFGRCASLQYIDLPESLETIGGQAFFRSGLRLLRVPGGCTLEARALMNAFKLKKVVFEDRTNGTFPMGANAFYGCKNLLKVYLPKKAYPYSIPGGAFADCTRLKAVYRTEHVQNVWNAAFEACTSLSVFTVPAGIENIGPGAFRGCTALKKLRVLAETSAFLSVEKDSADFLQDLPDTCRVYVKTAAMKRAVVNAGCPGKVIVKADLK
jgi:hypothetical protein